ncbi:hypothetical protein EJ04DRAFT_515910 [Polyplosphaeria fusca]|uniref:GST N-terminal domain-containing protein n=1 Tax=Polyplosphaeria fusca TaxID=682080 RepID=A0A9P4UXY3_9PLEO|nr:hypothetical protein EJ04DRAFT_515910 [Polyplosphaeria fusca]
MKATLFTTLTSPFARKCRIAITELRLSSQISLSLVNPWTDERLRAINPLCKVPTLLREDGTALYGSHVIVEYLASLSTSRALIPVEGEARWRALRLQAMVDDACSAAGRLYATKVNPASLDNSAAGTQRLRNAVLATLDQLEAETLKTESWNLGDMSAVLLPAYYNFRFPEDNWRLRRPRLAAFVDAMEKLPAFRDNQFQP